MAIQVIKLADLTGTERQACTDYGSDATMLHACAQGWSEDFDDSLKMSSLVVKALELTRQLDSAIGKFELSGDATVYSGHGRGFSVVGSLLGDPDKFIGFKYRYPGYISTSADRGVAENFLRTRAGTVGTPVLLEFRLKSGQHILPMHAAITHVGEAEYVLGRSLKFEIIGAEYVRVPSVTRDVLHVTLASA
jgi:hypothetical protein